MVQKQLLNQRQKRYLFQHIISRADQVKIFETDDLEWLMKQKVELMNSAYGWKALYMNDEKYTILNFPNNPGWSEVLDNIDDYDECQWCNEWFPKDELIYQRRGFTVLCRRCRDYLISREGEA